MLGFKLWSKARIRALNLGFQTRVGVSNEGTEQMLGFQIWGFAQRLAVQANVRVLNKELFTSWLGFESRVLNNSMTPARC